MDQSLSAPERRKLRLRRRIVEEAGRLYDENGGSDGGLENTTIEMICQRADISVTTFFRYFDSKLDAIYIDSRAAVHELVRLISLRVSREAPERAVINGCIEHLSDFLSVQGNHRRLLRGYTSPQFVERQAHWRAIALREISELIRPVLVGGGADLRALLIATVGYGLVDDAVQIWAQAPDQDVMALIQQSSGMLPGIASELADAIAERQR